MLDDSNGRPLGDLILCPLFLWELVRATSASCPSLINVLKSCTSHLEVFIMLPNLSETDYIAFLLAQMCFIWSRVKFPSTCTSDFFRYESRIDTKILISFNQFKFIFLYERQMWCFSFRIYYEMTKMCSWVTSHVIIYRMR